MGRRRCVLLHSQLRGTERAARVADVLGARADLIVVSAGEAASGLDLTAALVVAEAAPWPYMVRRIGRANRSGALREADVWWLPPPAPAERPGVGAACAELARLDGVRVTGEDLLARAVPGARHATAVLTGTHCSSSSTPRRPRRPRRQDRRPGPDRRGRERAGPMRTWVATCVTQGIRMSRWRGRSGPRGRRARPTPGCGSRRRVPLPRAALRRRVARRGRPRRLDQAAWEWHRVTAEWAPRPYELLVVAAADGGYDADAGFDPAAPGPVPGCPVLLTPDELAAQAAEVVAQAALSALTRPSGRTRRARPARPYPRRVAGSRSTSTASRSATRPPR